MRKPLALSFMVIVGACTEPPASAPITSIDGLEGGAFTSNVTAPSVSANEVTAKDISATRVTVQSDVSTQSITAQRVQSKSIQTEVIQANEMSVAQNAIAGGFALAAAEEQIQQNFMGRPIGVATLDIAGGGHDGYLGVDRLCRETHPGEGAAAHVCSAMEMLQAVRSRGVLTSEFDGAAYLAFNIPFIGRFADGQDKFGVTDCGSWFTSGIDVDLDQGPLAYRAMAMTVRLIPEGFGNAGEWHITAAECRQNMKLACCR